MNLADSLADHFRAKRARVVCQSPDGVTVWHSFGFDNIPPEYKADRASWNWDGLEGHARAWGILYIDDHTPTGADLRAALLAAPDLMRKLCPGFVFVAVILVHKHAPRNALDPRDVYTFNGRQSLPNGTWHSALDYSGGASCATHPPGVEIGIGDYNPNGAPIPGAEK